MQTPLARCFRVNKATVHMLPHLVVLYGFISSDSLIDGRLLKLQGQIVSVYVGQEQV